MRELRYHAAVVVHALVEILRCPFWPRTVRWVLARQVYFTGVQSLGIVLLLALLAGASIVVQTDLWLREVGQTELLGPILVAVLVRAVGPILVNVIVILRSGSAIATELGNMVVAQELRLLEAQGLDPFTYLVVPRILGVLVSVFSLTVLFVVVSLGSGYLCAVALGTSSMTSLAFGDRVLRSLDGADVANLLVNTLVPALFTGVLCCIGGLSAGSVTTEVPKVSTRALTRSSTALFLTAVLAAMLSYA